MIFTSNGQEKNLLDFLNSILIPDEDVDENKIVYLVDKFHELNKKNYKGMLNTDLDCRINTKKDKNMYYA